MLTGLYNRRQAEGNLFQSTTTTACADGGAAGGGGGTRAFSHFIFFCPLILLRRIRSSTVVGQLLHVQRFAKPTHPSNSLNLGCRRGWHLHRCQHLHRHRALWIVVRRLLLVALAECWCGNSPGLSNIQCCTPTAPPTPTSYVRLRAYLRKRLLADHLAPCRARARFLA